MGELDERGLNRRVGGRWMERVCLCVCVCGGGHNFKTKNRPSHLETVSSKQFL